MYMYTIGYNTKPNWKLELKCLLGQTHGFRENFHVHGKKTLVSTLVQER